MSRLMIQERTANISRAALSSLMLLLAAELALGQSSSKVIVPPYNDRYSKFVKQLEAGQTNVNYTEFRLSFLDSEQFKAAGKQSTELGDLRKKMYALMKESRSAEIVDVCNKMLSIDYTDMEAHKIVRQTYKILGNSAKEKKHHDIEFGLLNSIIKRGNGKTCQTAWPVIQVQEEYFVLEMIGAEKRSQSIDNTNRLCDKIEVRTDRGNQIYYFDVNKVFKGYNKRGIH